MNPAFQQALDSLRNQAAKATDSAFIHASYDDFLSGTDEPFRVELRFVLISGEDWTAAWAASIESLPDSPSACRHT